MIKFSRQFQQNVRDFYGSMIPNRVLEAFEEGDPEIIRTFLRAAMTENTITNDTVRFRTVIDLKIMNARWDTAHALLVRLDAEVEKQNRILELST